MRANARCYTFKILGGIFCLEDMRPYPLISDIATEASRWEQSPSNAPTPGDFGREQTPSVSCASSTYSYGDPSSPSHLPTSERLTFFEDTSPNRGGIHYEHTPESMKYLIEWKVAFNKCFLAKDTEQNLIFKSSTY